MDETESVRTEAERRPRETVMMRLVIVTAFAIVFADGFKSGDTTAWSQAYP